MRDNNYKHIENPKARKVLLNLKDKLNLKDPWRNQHENQKRYTWFGPSSKKGRIDFILVSSQLLNFVHNTSIKIGYRADHSIILIDIVFSKFEKGKGFWKFNISLQKDKEYINGVKKVIVSLKQRYTEAPNSQEAIEQIPDSNLRLNIDYQSFFEQILQRIRGYTIEYSSRKKKK